MKTNPRPEEAVAVFYICNLILRHKMSLDLRKKILRCRNIYDTPHVIGKKMGTPGQEIVGFGIKNGSEDRTFL